MSDDNIYEKIVLNKEKLTGSIEINIYPSKDIKRLKDKPPWRDVYNMSLVKD